MTEALTPTSVATTTPDPTDPGGRVYQRRWWTLAVLCLSLMVIGVDNTILNVALPTLVKDLNATTSQLQWIVDGYTLVFAGLLLTAGSLGDRFGRRRALSVGLAIFGTGSILSALAASPEQLIFMRCLMGIGAALIMPATLSIVTNVFRVPAERARAIAIWAGVSALGIAIGPLAGGYLLEHFYWGSVFLVNVPIVLLALVAGYFLVPDSKDPSAPRLDPIGAVLSIVGLTALVWSIIEAPTKGWGSTSTISGLAVALIILGAFAAWELHSDHPMLNVGFFKNPRFTAASQAITLTFFALFGSLFLITQYLQTVLGYSALGRRRPHPALRGGDDGSRAPERQGGRALRYQARRVRWAHLRGRRPAGHADRRTELELLARVLRLRDHGGRHGLHHGARHRVDHGIVAP